MSEITDEDRRRVAMYYGAESRARQESATSSKQSFFSWLREVGLAYIVQKLLDIIWETIKRWLGF